MNALDIIQSSAKRLHIMIPTTIVQPANIDSSAIDYDANLLLESLNSTIKQIVENTGFKDNERIFSRNRLGTIVLLIGKHELIDGKYYQDFFIPIEEHVPDLVSILGEGITFTLINNNTSVEAFKYEERKYLFRELDKTEFLSIKRVLSSTEIVPTIDEERARKEGVGAKKDLPSENISSVIRAENKESGFYVIDDTSYGRGLYFCNSLISDDVLTNMDKELIIEFLYQGNFAVIDKTNINTPIYKSEVSKDTDIIKINSELLILGTIINYKSSYGLDYSLELGQQKTLTDSLIKNQQNILITKTEKKIYI